ncbi:MULTISPECIES: hypothetical protein [unclassified Bartonella]|uniref:hypothetical protein n=1 Tax=unclassified Bartonella TaxID=2645622 RepID=UPI00235F5D01|nr:MULTISPECIES: hypothetical protein [unclassified Bartonella]
MNGIGKEHHHLYAYETKTSIIIFHTSCQCCEKNAGTTLLFYQRRDGGALWILRYLIHG